LFQNQKHKKSAKNKNKNLKFKIATIYRKRKKHKIDEYAVMLIHSKKKIEFCKCMCTRIKTTQAIIIGGGSSFNTSAGTACCKGGSGKR
jgi:hypothetical protein